MTTIENKNKANNHSKKYIASGIIISNLLMVFLGSFLFGWYWRLEEFNGVFPFLLIILVTFCSSIASYFWSHTQIPLKSLRMLALIHLIWVWIILCFQPYFGLAQVFIDKEIQSSQYLWDNFLYIFTGTASLLIIIFCSLLGNWFGRRVFYE
jgi:hypothetical protein